MPGPPVDPLDGDREADVCIVGGGYSGLSVALHLARAGANVVLVEAERLGWGASGRGSGEVRVGLPRDQQWLENELGLADSIVLWRLLLDARAHLDWLIGRYDILCDLVPGLLRIDRSRSEHEETRRYIALLQDHYAYPHVRAVEGEELRALVGARGARGGMIDMRGGHLHPLNLVLGLAQAAYAEGALLCDRTTATAITRSASLWQVTTVHGTITAHRLVIAGDGQRHRLEPELASRVVVLDTPAAATEPLAPDHAGDIIRGTHAVIDDRSGSYFRLTSDGRLLFGNSRSRSGGQPEIGEAVGREVRRLFPQLKDVRVDYVWGSGLAVTRNRLPYVRQERPGLYVLGGYAGSQTVLAPYFGKLIANAIAGGDADFDRLTQLPAQRFPARPLMRGPTQRVAMSLLALRDRL